MDNKYDDTFVNMDEAKGWAIRGLVSSDGFKRRRIREIILYLLGCILTAIGFSMATDHIYKLGWKDGLRNMASDRTDDAVRDDVRDAGYAIEE